MFLIENESNSGEEKQSIINVRIYEVNLNLINNTQEFYSSVFALGESSPVCCFKGDCYKCIDNSSLNYPVVFVHGHSFNEKLSAEISMGSFGEMARQFENYGYTDIGYFYGSNYDLSSKGYLGRINSSIVLEATYYLDTLITEEGSFILDSKLEDIGTYAFRLNEIISNVKYLTGKDKVIIVAHSMGGLVVRRYIQSYGEENIEKVILVGTPNQGVDGIVLTSCPVFGANIECSQMKKGSQFMSELNNNSHYKIPFYNVIGIGCFWENSNGDGIIKENNAYLDGVENIYVNGTCNGVDFLHVEMIKPSKYPEIFN